MPIQRFNCDKDAKYVKRRDAEKHLLHYTPKRWLIHQRDTTPLNIYGEPGEITTSVDGTDGATSAPATRQFVSAGSNFTTAGVNVSDILEIRHRPCEDADTNALDNGRYTITQIVNSTTLQIDEDWPEGNLNELDYKVHILKERYIEHPQLIPFLVKLNPTEKALTTWGINEVRDAMVELSVQLFEDMGVDPKIGDRFIYDYGVGDRDIHYEIKNLFEADQLTDTGKPLHWIGFAKRTTNRLP